MIAPSIAEILQRCKRGANGVISGVCAMADVAAYKDITAKADKMPRGACLLYRNRKPKGDDPWSYYGVLKQEDGQMFWVLAWPRVVNGETVIELKFTPKRT